MATTHEQTIITTAVLVKTALFLVGICAGFGVVGAEVGAEEFPTAGAPNASYISNRRPVGSRNQKDRPPHLSELYSYRTGLPDTDNNALFAES